jgi:hypothetical protein
MWVFLCMYVCALEAPRPLPLLSCLWVPDHPIQILPHSSTTCKGLSIPQAVPVPVLPPHPLCLVSSLSWMEQVLCACRA